MKLKAYPSKIEGVKLLTSEIHEDNRGLFDTTYQKEEFEALGLPTEWKQDNFSLSFLGVLRGLHIQKKNPQGKLVRPLHGVIFDVWVDLRKDSRTFKQVSAMTLDAANGEGLYLPPGLAHGFFCLSRHAIVHYKCTELWDKESDSGINWTDRDLKIDWPFPDEMDPLVSPRDANLPTLAAYLEQLE